MNIYAIQEDALQISKDRTAVRRKGKWGMIDFHLTIYALYETLDELNSGIQKI